MSSPGLERGLLLRRTGPDCSFQRSTFENGYVPIDVDFGLASSLSSLGSRRRLSASRRPVGGRRIFNFFLADDLVDMECLPARLNELAFCSQRSNLAANCELGRGISYGAVVRITTPQRLKSKVIIDGQSSVLDDIERLGLDPRQLEENIPTRSFDLLASINDGLENEETRSTICLVKPLPRVPRTLFCRGFIGSDLPRLEGQLCRHARRQALA
jgi:hypothetical protein